MDDQRRKTERGQDGELPAEVDAVSQADPTIGAPASAAGGIGGTDDGTQVPHRPSTAVPGRPGVPRADEPGDRASFEAQALDTPVSEPHSERGGSG